MTTNKLQDQDSQPPSSADLAGIAVIFEEIEDLTIRARQKPEQQGETFWHAMQNKSAGQPTNW